MIRRAASGLIMTLLALGGAADCAEYGDETKRYVERGVAAAGRADWNAAVEEFTKAEAKASRNHPQILFNLGVAHAEAGHELTGAAWFMAYLSHAPKARNAAKIMWEVDRLKTAHIGKIDKLFALAHATADDIRDEALRGRTRRRIALQQAGLTDLQSLSRMLSEDKDITAAQRSEIWKRHALEMAGAAELLAAEAMIGRISLPADRDKVWRRIIRTYVWRFDLPSARRVCADAAFEDPALRKELLDLIKDAGEFKVRSKYPIGSYEWFKYSEPVTHWRYLGGLFAKSPEFFELEELLHKRSRVDAETGKRLEHYQIPTEIARLAARLGRRLKLFRYTENQQAWDLARGQRISGASRNRQDGFRQASIKNYEDAAVKYMRAVVFQPKDSALRTSYAGVLSSLGRTDEEIAQWRKAILLGFKANGDLALAHKELGSALAAKGRTNEALKQYRKSISFPEGSSEPETHIRIGAILADKGKFDAAIKHYRKAIAVCPTSGWKAAYAHEPKAEAYDHWGAALVGKGLLDEGIAAYTQAISLNRTADTFHNRALVFHKKGEFGKAIKDWKDAALLEDDGVNKYWPWIKRAKKAQRQKEAGSARGRAHRPE